MATSRSRVRRNAFAHKLRAPPQQRSAPSDRGARTGSRTIKWVRRMLTAARRQRRETQRNDKERKTRLRGAIRSMHQIRW